MHEVDISFNSVGNKVYGGICRVIEKNKTLKKLIVWHSHLTEKAAIRILKALHERNFEPLHVDLGSSEFLSEEIVRQFGEYAENVRYTVFWLVQYSFIFFFLPLISVTLYHYCFDRNKKFFFSFFFFQVFG